MVPPRRPRGGPAGRIRSATRPAAAERPAPGGRRGPIGWGRAGAAGAVGTGPPRPTRWIAAVVLLVAVAFDVARLQPLASLGTSMLVVVAVGALLASGRVRNRATLPLGFGAVLLATLVSLRTSPWLVAPRPRRGAGAGGAHGRLRRGRVGPGHDRAVAGPSGRSGLRRRCAWPRPSRCGCAASCIPARSPDRRRRLAAVGRGVGLAVPIVVVLALLLASADAVFASLFTLPVDLGSMAGHVAFVGIGIVIAATLLVDASLPAFEERRLDATPVGATETTVVLASIAVLYGAFAAVQVVSARRGADHVIETAGLTYADHARQGFFQLLAVAALTLVVVCGLRAATRFESGRQRLVVALFGEAVVVLTLVIVAVAVQRLGLYEEAFGATMLRLACTAFAWWLGAVFVLVGIRLAGVGGSHRWLTAAVVTSAVAALVAWNVVNPEPLVVERNLEHLARSGELDTEYLWQLSDDAVPSMAVLLASLEPGTPQHARVQARICRVAANGSTLGRTGSGLVESESGSGAAYGSGRATVPGPGAPGGPDADRGLGANRSATLAADTRALVCS